MAKFFQGMKLIDHVRYINVIICPEVYGSKLKISFIFQLPKEYWIQTLQHKNKNVCPQNFGAILQYCYYKRSLVLAQDFSLIFAFKH